MLDEDEQPIRKRTRLEKPVLDTLGIEEMREYISELKEEIARVEADIERKPVSYTHLTLPTKA